MQDHTEAVYNDAMDSQKDIQTFSLVPNSSEKFRNNFPKTRTQMVLMVVVAIFAIFSIVFVGMYIYISRLLCLNTSVNRSILVIVFSPLFLPFIFILAIKSMFSIMHFAVDSYTSMSK